VTRGLRRAALLVAALGCAGCEIGPDGARIVLPAEPDFSKPFHPAIDCSGPVQTPDMDPRCATYRRAWDL
jgi:hypothetical protein